MVALATSTATSPQHPKAVTTKAAAAAAAVCVDGPSPVAEEVALAVPGAGPVGVAVPVEDAQGLARGSRRGQRSVGVAMDHSRRPRRHRNCRWR